MEDWQVSMQIQAMAIMTKVEGMKVMNHQCKHHREPPHGKGEFEYYAGQLDRLANAILSK